MRIVDVNEFYSPTGGGVRTYCDRKMELMAARGHELIVIAPGREDGVEERPGGGRIVYVKSPKMPFDANYGLFWDEGPIAALLDRFDPDVVECCSPWKPAWFVARWQGPQARAIKSFFMHNDNLDAYAKRLLRGVIGDGGVERAFGWYNRYLNRFLAQFDTVVTNGPALTKRMAGRGIRIDATLTLGIERRDFSPDLRDEALRASLLDQCGLPADAQLLLGIGRHHGEKRWGMVFDAVERAGASMPVGLAVLGRGPSTRAMERRIAASPHIRLFRPIHDRRRIATLMASADAFIHGNETETFGLVVGEALASGTPLIVPDQGGASEFARPPFAETYRGGDARSAADAILRLFERDQALLRRAARVAAANARTDVDHVETLLAHYGALVAARTGRRASRSA